MDYAITVVLFFLLFIPLCPAHPLVATFTNLSSCPWVIHISSPLGFSISYTTLKLPLFFTYHLCFLFPVPFPLFFPLPLSSDNPPFSLIWSYSSCLLSLFLFLLFLGSVVDSCEFVVILLFIFFIFFFLDNFL